MHDHMPVLSSDATTNPLSNLETIQCQHASKHYSRESDSAWGLSRCD